MAEPVAPDEPWIDGVVVSTEEGADDRNFVEVLRGKITTTGVQQPTVDLEELIIALELFEVTIESTPISVDVGYKSETTEQTELHWHAVTFGPVAPMVATIFSSTAHGTPLLPGTGSTNVFAEGKPVWRTVRDLHACPCATPALHGVGVAITLGPPHGVYVNGYAVARAGDAVGEALGGANPIATGAATVHAGSPAPPITTIDPRPETRIVPDPWYKRWADWVVDVDVDVGVSVDLAPSTDVITVGGEFDVDDRAGSGKVRYEAAGELVHGRGWLDVDFQFFGGAWSPDIEWQGERGAGKWSGYFDVSVDAATRKPAFDADIDLGEPG